MLIDTHCHLDAGIFDDDREQLIQLALDQGISTIVVPSTSVQNFDAVIALHQQYSHCHYALGIHPMLIDQSADDDLDALESYLAHYQPIAIGEIGLDYFITKANRDKQIAFFYAQLKLAEQHELPVILHVRNAIDDVLKGIRQHRIIGGIAHAFNGSMQQAEQFIKLGFKLGFGGAMTYSRAKKLRMLAKALPIEAIVLETDAPDMPPSWLPGKARNAPNELSAIAAELAEIRGLELAEVRLKTSQNAMHVLPKIPNLYT